MKKYFFLLSFFTSTVGFSQNASWVFFKDKVKGDFDPCTYFDEKAIERRAIHKVDLNDPSDWPVNPAYIDQVKPLADSTGYATRWLNALLVYTDSVRLEQIKRLPFVDHVEEAIRNSGESYLASAQPEYDVYIWEILAKHSRAQISRMKGEEFTKRGISGKGIRIAILDGGFDKVDYHDAFGHLRSEGLIFKTYDFIHKREDVYGQHYHGSSVLSNVGGKMQQNPVGLATDASFMLAITEGRATNTVDEEHWLEAAEWADRYGAQIINTSLGYHDGLYKRKDMNGKTTVISRAANAAAGKGILVVVSAGNEGESKWHFVCAPGDADSVLTVGAIDPNTGIKSEFSSYGPTADGRMKPNVCAYGTATVAKGRGYSKAYGTSFASPLIAGFAACVLELYPKMTNMQLMDELQKSADLYPYYDYMHGFGVPQANYFLKDTALNSIPPSKDSITSYFTIEEDSLFIRVKVDTTALSSEEQDFIQHDLSKKLESQREKDESITFLDEEQLGKSYFERFEAPYFQDYPELVFYHLTDADGKMILYRAVTARTNEPVKLFKADLTKGTTLRVHFKGSTKTFQVK